MNLFQRHAGAPRRQRGTAALELALVLIATMVLLPALVLFARVFYQYNILKQASQNAVSYMAALPLTSITDLNAISAAEQVAISIVRKAATDAKILSGSSVGTLKINCDGGACGSETIPTSIEGVVLLQVQDLGTSGYTSDWINKATRKWQVTIHTSVPYRNHVILEK